MKPTDHAELLNQLERLGVRSGGVLLVHTSFRAVRPVADGPLGLIEALRAALGPAGTLVMPTMTAGKSIFDPKTTPTKGMGVTADLFWPQPGVIRSTHPAGSFAAQGPRAEELCAPQPLSPPHGPDSPVGRVHDLDGQVLLLGVGYDACTTLHLAESLAGVPYSVFHSCVVEVDGSPRTVMIPETDHCCQRFALAEGWLAERGLQRKGRVGHGTARLCQARELVVVAVERLKRDPLIFLCPPSDHCGECDVARRSAEIGSPLEAFRGHPPAN